VVSGSRDQTVRVWDLATGAPVGDPFTGHTHAVNAVAVAELNGRPVALSGGDRTVRVWDLATGAPVGDPFTGHTRAVIAVAAAELDGRPVVVSGGGDQTVRVWDLATGAPVGDPFTGHTHAVIAVAAAELDGRPVVVSGGRDQTVRVWDLATGAPVGDPCTGHAGSVYAVVCQTRQGFSLTSPPVYIGVGATNIATVSGVFREGDSALRWERIAATEVTCNIRALELTSKRFLIVAAELGIIVFDTSSALNTVSHSL
jgi:WD40 repeat protein